jgi:hypothetical protein
VDVSKNTVLTGGGEEDAYLRLFLADLTNFGTLGPADRADPDSSLSVFVIDGSVYNHNRIQNSYLTLTENMINEAEAHWAAGRTRVYGVMRRNVTGDFDSDIDLLSDMDFIGSPVLLKALETNGYAIRCDNSVLELRGPVVQSSIYLRGGEVLVSLPGVCTVNQGLVLSAPVLRIAGGTTLRTRSTSTSLDILATVNIERGGTLDAHPTATTAELNVRGSIFNNGTVRFPGIGITKDLTSDTGAMWAAGWTSLLGSVTHRVRGELDSSLRVLDDGTIFTELLDINGTVAARGGLKIRGTANTTVTLRGKRQETPLNITMNAGELVYAQMGVMTILEGLSIMVPLVIVRSFAELRAAGGGEREIDVRGDLRNEGRITADAGTILSLQVLGSLNNDGTIEGSRLIVAKDLRSSGTVACELTTLRGSERRTLYGTFDGALSILPTELDVEKDVNVTGTLTVRQQTRLTMSNGTTFRLMSESQKTAIALVIEYGTLEFGTPGVMFLVGNVDVRAELGALVTIGESASLAVEGIVNTVLLSVHGMFVNHGHLVSNANVWMGDRFQSSGKLDATFDGAVFNAGEMRCSRVTLNSHLVTSGLWTPSETRLGGVTPERVFSGVLGGGGLWVMERSVFLLPAPLELNLPIFRLSSPAGGVVEPLTYSATALQGSALDDFTLALEGGDDDAGTLVALIAGGKVTDARLRLGASRVAVTLSIIAPGLNVTLGSPDDTEMIGLYADVAINASKVFVDNGTAVVGFAGADFIPQRRLVVEGDLYVMGTLGPYPFPSERLEDLHVLVKGDVFNEGFVSCTVLVVEGSIDNSGSWRAGKTVIVGEEAKLIEGRPISGAVEIPSNVTILGNVSFAGPVNCIGSITLEEGATLQLLGEALGEYLWVKEGAVELATDGVMKLDANSVILASHVVVLAGTRLVAGPGLIALSLSFLLRLSLSSLSSVSSHFVSFLSSLCFTSFLV